MRKATLFAVVLAILLVASVRVQPLAVAQQEAAPAADVVTDKPDVVTDQLFREYVAVNGKIDSSSVDAAIELVATRGVDNGYWRTVLAEFEKTFDTDDNSAVRKNTLSVLSKMLAIDASARWIEQCQRVEASPQQRAAPPQAASGVQSVPASNLGPEVLEQVIARAYEVRHLFDLVDYVVAVRQAHDERGEEFLLDVLRGPQRDDDHWKDPQGGTWPEAQFQAAVALAELGRAEGVEWLIAHTDATGTTLFRVPHAKTDELYLACRYALTELTGHQPAPTRGDLQQAQWLAWWQSNAKQFHPTQAVALRVP
jgi:hypothetical protein